MLFYSGHDNRLDDDFKIVTERSIKWSLSEEGVISVDPYGRVETLAVGSVEVTVTSNCDANVFDKKKIIVIDKP